MKKLQIIDLVRSFSILSVLAFHFKAVFPKEAPEILNPLWEHFQRNGQYGVSVFFVISGFLITRIIDLTSGGLFQVRWKDFYIRRIARIIPLFLLAVLGGLGLSLWAPDGAEKTGYFFKLPNLPWALSFWIPLFSFSFNWFLNNTHQSWGGVGVQWFLFWSLAVEEQFYIFYPIALGFFKNTRRLAAVLVLIYFFSFLWRLVIFLTGNKNWGMASFNYFDQIAAGALLYLSYKHQGKQLSGKHLESFIVMLLGLSIFLATYWFTCDFLIAAHHVFAGSLISLGVYLFLLGGLHLDFFESRYLSWMAVPGKYSYGNYLIHMIVLYFLHGYLLKLGILSAFLVFALVSTILASVSFHLYETPMNQFVRGFFSKSNPSKKG